MEVIRGGRIAMCGRFLLTSTTHELENRFKKQGSFGQYQNKPFITPGMVAPIITNDAITLATWGLGHKIFNARAETITKFFPAERCLVPVSGFFEWKHTEKEKIPYVFTVKNEKLFTLAGLFDAWRDAEGVVLKTFTIITTVPNALIAPIHDRMPVILSKGHEEPWLATGNVRLDPYPAQSMQAAVWTP